MKHVPMLKPSPYSKCWWTKEKLARRSYERWVADEDPIHEAFQQARNNYSEMIQTTKVEHWTEWLESLDGEEVWSANQLVTGPASDGGRS